MKILLRLGHCRRRCADDLRGDGGDDVARRLPRADFRGDRMVARRRLGHGDVEFPLHGRRRLPVGRAFRPLWNPHRRAVRRGAARDRAGRGEPGDIALAVPDHLRRAGRLRRRKLLCADDCGRERLDRQASQPCRRARLRRHGRRAADGGAVRKLADHHLRLAHGDADHRHRRVRDPDPGVAVGAAAAERPLRQGTARGRRRRGRCADDGGAGVPHAAVHHAGAGALRLLRVPFGTDLPHGDLRARSAASRRWPRSASMASPDCPASAAGLRSARWRTASAPSRCWSAACSCRRLSAATYLAVGQLGEFYALSVVFGLAYGGVMPLYAILVREYFGEKIMGTVFGAITMVASLGMAIGPWAGGMVFDAFNSYALALYRLVQHRPCRGGGGADVPDGRAPTAATGDGLRAHEQAAGLRPRRARANAQSPDRARSRRDRADAAPDAGGGRGAHRQRPLSRAAAEDAGGAEAPLEVLHADARGDREGRRQHGVVPRPVQRLRDGRRPISTTMPRARCSQSRTASSPGARSAASVQAVPGGYRATGRWEFASGVRQASWLGAHVQIVEADGTRRRHADGAPVVRTILFPVASAALHDVWDVIGLKGTGTDSYSIEELFIPERFAAPRDEADGRRAERPALSPSDRQCLRTWFRRGFAGCGTRNAGRRDRACARQGVVRPEADARQQRRAGGDRPRRGELSRGACLSLHDGARDLASP